LLANSFLWLIHALLELTVYTLLLQLLLFALLRCAARPHAMARHPTCSRRIVSHTLFRAISAIHAKKLGGCHVVSLSVARLVVIILAVTTFAEQ